MKAVRFFTQVGEDRTIRVPEGLELTPGQAEVIVLQTDGHAQRDTTPANAPQEHLFDKLAKIARQLSVGGDLPPDLAQNHDHYLHGLPKGIDES